MARYQQIKNVELVRNYARKSLDDTSLWMTAKRLTGEGRTVARFFGGVWSGLTKSITAIDGKPTRFIWCITKSGTDETAPVWRFMEHDTHSAFHEASIPRSYSHACLYRRRGRINTSEWRYEYVREETR